MIALPSHAPCGIAGYGPLDLETFAATCVEVRAWRDCPCRGDRHCQDCGGSGRLVDVSPGCGRVVGVCAACGLRACWDGAVHVHTPSEGAGLAPAGGV